MMTKKKILLVNGPNLRLLGRREPEIYGRTTLAEIENACRECAEGLGFGLECFQSDSEGALITCIGEAPLEGFCGIVINPAGYTHTSVALHDALLAGAVVTVAVINLRLSGRQMENKKEFSENTLLELQEKPKLKITEL